MSVSARHFPRRTRSRSALEVVGLVLAFLVVVVALIAIEAWALMLLLGALHSLTGWDCAIGFWASVVVALIASMFLGGGAAKS